MRMLFILCKAHDGYECGLRGVERLLCTLLCTVPVHSYDDLRQRYRRGAGTVPKVRLPPFQRSHYNSRRLPHFSPATA
jgi:hypothetical protein